MLELRSVLKPMFEGAVLFAVSGMFVGAMRRWEMVYGLMYGALVGAMLGFGFGVVRLLATKWREEDARFENRRTLWKLLSENQRLASKIGLLVFGVGGVFFILSQVVIIADVSVGRTEAVVSLCLGMVSLCVACVLLVIRLHSAKEHEKVNR